MKLNKYTELHERLMDLLAHYHNTHIGFIERPSMWTQRDLIRIMMDMARLVKEIKKNNLAMRKQMREEVKIRKAAKAANNPKGK